MNLDDLPKMCVVIGCMFFVTVKLMTWYLKLWLHLYRKTKKWSGLAKSNVGIADRR